MGARRCSPSAVSLDVVAEVEYWLGCNGGRRWAAGLRPLLRKGGDMSRMPRGIAAALVVCSLVASDALAQDSDSGGVEEIVVRARKRDELIQDTPVSVTALSETFLEESGVVRLDDIQGFAPNVIFNTGNQGFDANIKIRGVGTSAPALAFDPGVGIYMDGVFMPRALGALLDVADVQQIEVLRGPQGTLFGKNTVGGAVLLTTVKPREELEAAVRVRAGNFDTVETKAMLNVPVVEDFLLSRIAFSSRNTRGYTRNNFPDAAARYWSDHQAQNVLGSLRLLPDSDEGLVPTRVDVSASYSRDHTHGRGAECVIIARPDGSIPSSQFLIDQGSPGFADSCRRSGPFHFEANVPSIADVESYGVWGTVNWELGEIHGVDVDFRSLTGWRHQNSRIRFDIDNTAVDFLDRRLTGGPEEIDGEPIRQTQINQELQFNATAWDDRISLVTGLFLFWEESSERSVQDAGLVDNALGFERITRIDFDFDNWTVALFGQGTVDVTDWLSLTGGIRWTEDKKGARRREFDLVNDSQLYPIEGLPGDGTGRRVFTSWTPMASLRLIAPDDFLDETPFDHLMSYFTYSRGFKGGGFNATPSGRVMPEDNILESFEPETLDNFEIGMKSRSFDNRLSLSLALFWGIYDDIQVTSSQSQGVDEVGLPIIARVVRNAAEAEIGGVELEAVLRPIDDLVLSGNVGYTHTEFKDYGKGCTPTSVDQDCPISDLNGLQIDRSGQSFVGTPALQTFVSAQYTFDIDTDNEILYGSLTPLIQWTYSSSYRLLGQEVAEGRQSGYNLINARLAYNFWDERATVAAWGKNLTDEAYFDSIQGFGDSFGNVNRYYREPRTYGGEISYKF